MSPPIFIADWIAFFAGLGVLAMAAGEWRYPGGWEAMLAEMRDSAALRFSAGLGTLAIGAAILLAAPLRTYDALSLLLAAMGGIAVAEGLVLLAAGQPLLDFGHRQMQRRSELFAAGSGLVGVVLIGLALARIT
ncbi:hypothetical protein F7D01_09755 [Erythrobacter sp. 3-20A1M]|uniref:hypothetical protein n=1 Tax=Erythrobacter sp. 3-20A1M TaxID=2653850 RepID=UPI001BFCA4BF|nr:hypothetical protein [Erythrobacter sp. 3-20A1M]QWC57332.1 hypothetical protein F7D01_09755 [Erythrobacter sp. 3-20A1M]